MWLCLLWHIVFWLWAQLMAPHSGTGRRWNGHRSKWSRGALPHCSVLWQICFRWAYLQGGSYPYLPICEIPSESLKILVGALRCGLTQTQTSTYTWDFARHEKVPIKGQKNLHRFVFVAQTVIMLFRNLGGLSMIWHQMSKGCLCNPRFFENRSEVSQQCTRTDTQNTLNDERGTCVCMYRWGGTPTLDWIQFILISIYCHRTLNISKHNVPEKA